MVLQRDDGCKLFTGYLTMAPQLEYLGTTQTGTAWRYGLNATDDSWLLDHNAPTARTPFVYRTAGDALRTITNDVLPGVLDDYGRARPGLREPVCCEFAEIMGRACADAGDDGTGMLPSQRRKSSYFSRWGSRASALVRVMRSFRRMG